MPIQLQGKEYVTHEELVQWATEEGIESITTTIIHVDIERRECIVQATATGKRGSFQGLGDALANVKGNVGGMVSSAFIRMAETRAVNRALRLYTGRGATSADELGSLPREDPAPAPRQHSPAWKQIGKAMCAKLTEAGYDYNDVAAWCESKGWGRPSGWPDADHIRHMVDDVTSGGTACPRKS